MALDVWDVKKWAVALDVWDVKKWAVALDVWDVKKWAVALDVWDVKKWAVVWAKWDVKKMSCNSSQLRCGQVLSVMLVGDVFVCSSLLKHSVLQLLFCVCIDTRFYLCVCGGWWLSLSNRSQTASGKCPRCQNASQSNAADTIAKPGAVSELLTLLAVSSFSSVIFWYSVKHLVWSCQLHMYVSMLWGGGGGSGSKVCLPEFVCYIICCGKWSFHGEECERVLAKSNTHCGSIFWLDSQCWVCIQRPGGILLPLWGQEVDVCGQISRWMISVFIHLIHTLSVNFVCGTVY